MHSGHDNSEICRRPLERIVKLPTLDTLRVPRLAESCAAQHTIKLGFLVDAIYKCITRIRPSLCRCRSAIPMLCGCPTEYVNPSIFGDYCRLLLQKSSTVLSTELRATFYKASF